MKLLYDLGIFLYGLIVRIASLFNPKAKLFIVGRKNVWDKLGEIKKENIVWFHAASLGEFEQGKPVMELLKQNHPEINLVVSFFSPSGYEQRKDWPLATTCYLPLDTPANAKRFIKLLHTHTHTHIPGSLKEDLTPSFALHKRLRNLLTRKIYLQCEFLLC